MCMRAESEKCEIAKSLSALDARVDGIDSRLVAVETKQNEHTQTMREGFAEVKAMMHDYYAERVAWGDWARHALNNAGQWLAKYGSIILLVALGLGNAEKIAGLFK